jgi:hypothetical protein
MAIGNIYPSVLFANADGVDNSVTIARQGGPGWAFSEVQLAWISNNATAQAWISGMSIQVSPDQIDNPVWPDPGGAYIGTWTDNCLSATFTLRVSGGYAAANAKLSSWL